MSNIEIGRTKPSAAVADRIARALRCPSEVIAGAAVHIVIDANNVRIESEKT